MAGSIQNLPSSCFIILGSGMRPSEYPRWKCSTKEQSFFFFHINPLRLEGCLLLQHHLANCGGCIWDLKTRYLQPTRTVSGLQQVLNKRLLMFGNTKWSTTFLDRCSRKWMTWIATRLIILGYSEKVMKTFRKCWSGQGHAEWMKRATSGSTDWKVLLKANMFSTVTPFAGRLSD